MADVLITGTPQIQFKHGSQENLNALRTASKAVAGTFYLTNDTHRLYVGVDGGDAVPVDESITSVASFGALPDASPYNKGNFYYLTAENILAVSNGSKWIQINPNDNTTYNYSGLTSSVTGGVSVKTYITDNDKNEKAFTFTLEGTNGIGITVDTSTHKITVKGPTIAAVKSDGNDGGTKDVVYVGLHDTTKTTELKTSDFKSKVGFKAGSNVTLTESGDVVTIASANTKLKQSDLTGGSVLDTGFRITAKDTDGNTAGGDINPKIVLCGATSVADTDTRYEFKKVTKADGTVEGIVKLPVYTRAEVDSKFQLFDAMTYKGVISAALPTTAQNGDTYKAGKNYLKSAGDPVDAEIGDLIIAKSGEGSGTIVWEVVPAGDETDTTYTFETTSVTQGGKITATDAVSKDVVGTFGVKADGTYLSGSLGSDKVVTISHKTVTKADTEKAVTKAATAKHDQSLYTVYAFDEESKDASDKKDYGVVRDGAGHVKSVNTKAWQIRDTNAILVDGSTSISVSGSTATITPQAKLLQANGDDYYSKTAFQLSSANAMLTMSATSNKLTLDLKWSSFDANNG